MKFSSQKIPLRDFQTKNYGNITQRIDHTLSSLSFFSYGKIEIETICTYKLLGFLDVSGTPAHCSCTVPLPGFERLFHYFQCYRSKNLYRVFLKVRDNPSLNFHDWLPVDCLNNDERTFYTFFLLVLLFYITFA